MAIFSKRRILSLTLGIVLLGAAHAQPWSHQGQSGSWTYTGVGVLPSTDVTTMNFPMGTYGEVLHTDDGKHIVASSGFPSSTGLITCFDNAGTTLWTFACEQLSGGTPAVGPDGGIYFGSENPFGQGFSYCLNSDGSLRWRSYVTSNVRIYASPIVSDGVVCFATINGGNGVYALDAATGTPLWQRLGLGETYVLALAPDGNLLVTAGDGGDGQFLRKLDIHTGGTMWSGGPRVGVVAVLADGTGLAANDNNGSHTVYRLNLTTGSVIGATSYPSSGWVGLAISPDQQTAYTFTGLSQQVRAFDIATLANTWTATLDHGPGETHGMLVGADNTVYVCSGEGSYPGDSNRVTAIDGATGIEVLQIPIPTKGQISMDDVGRIYVESNYFVHIIGGVSNSDPHAVDDEAQTNEDASVLIDVLANDSDPDNDTLTIDSIGSPSNGTAQQLGQGVQYTPNANFYGTDSFTYTITDGNGGFSTATVFVTIVRIMDDFSITGFFEPVRMGLTNLANAGRTIPLKFRVTAEDGSGYEGLVLSDVTVTSNQTGTGSLPGDEVETYSGSSGLQNLGGGLYQYNWRTSREYAGQIRWVYLSVSREGFTFSPSEIAAQFRFK